ncbi:hypothetical protein BS78_02G103400 [Paspalum vaginatum]|nr:hypothetical protein BS78_02G103400 [Paspalum vaginatum]
MATPTPDPTPLPPAAAEEEEDEEKERPWPPPMKMKLAPYAMYRVFDGLGPAGEALAAAYLGIHVLLYVVQFLSLSAVPERARFWAPVRTFVASTCIAANALIICAFIRYYMDVDGVYVIRELDPSQQQQPALPPPPPEMDMC